MIEIVKFLRNAFVTILALFASFIAGIMFGNKLIEEGVKRIFTDDRPKNRSEVSYRNMYQDKDQG